MLVQAAHRLAHAAAIVMKRGAHRAGEPLLEVIQTLLLLQQSRARMHELQSRRRGVEAIREHAQLASHPHEQAIGGTRKRFQTGGPIRHDELRRARGSRGPRIRNEIGNGEVDLVPDAAHHGNRARMNRARDALIVESPEVLEAAAAARDDQHIALRPRVFADTQRADDPRNRDRALNVRRINNDPSRRKSPGQDVQNVANGRPRR